jgi:hypothetical protein
MRPPETRLATLSPHVSVERLEEAWIAKLTP